MSEETYRTKSGRILTDADIQALSDEAERGYDVSHLKSAPDNVRGEAINLIVVEALRDALISLEEDDKHRAIKMIRKVINLLQDKASDPEELHNPDLTDQERESFMDALEELEKRD